VSRWQLPRWAREGNARIARGRTPVGAVHLMKPLTYMNDSGKALKGLRAAVPGDAIPDLLILVDDFALDVGTFRLRGAGSSGGHNGLKSIEATLGTRAYARLRIGVGPKPGGVDQAQFVLDELPRADRDLVKDLLPEMCEAVECWAAMGIERAMATYNKKQTAGNDPAD
jgi:PTH1 family peptidyl-tRNA hydrolase